MPHVLLYCNIYFYYEYIHATQEKKSEVDFEGHTFKAPYSLDYFVTELGGKPLLHLLCRDNIAMLKDYNILCWPKSSFGFCCVFLNFIYLFLATLGLCCCVQAFSSCDERRLLFIVVHVLLTAVASH